MKLCLLSLYKWVTNEETELVLKTKIKIPENLAETIIDLLEVQNEDYVFCIDPKEEIE